MVDENAVRAAESDRGTAVHASVVANLVARLLAFLALFPTGSACVLVTQRLSEEYQERLQEDQYCWRVAL